MLFIIIGVYSKSLLVLSILVSVSYVIKFFITTYSLTVKGFGKKWYLMYKDLWPEVIAMIISSVVFLILDFNSVTSFFASGIIKGVICTLIFSIVYSITGQIKILNRFKK